MFDIDPKALARMRVLDCPAGPASFVATATERGINATGVDVLYHDPPPMLSERCDDAIEETADQLRSARELFLWDYYGSVEDRVALLERAASRFLAEYPSGRTDSRYVAAELPRLPFADDWFSVVLSSHLLFLYGDRLSMAFHRESVLELARVATDEVRIYPLVELDGTPYPRLDAIRDELAAAGHRSTIRPVPFEVLRGATDMLVVEA